MVKKATLKKKKNEEENKIILKIDNKWEFLSYVFKYRMKEFLLLIIVILVFILVLNYSGLDIGGIIDSIFGDKK